jgi:hypothetical protein
MTKPPSSEYCDSPAKSYFKKEGQISQNDAESLVSADENYNL